MRDERRQAAGGIIGTIILALCMLVALPFRALPEAPRTYTFAVVPQVPVVDVQKKWTPFLKKLSTETGMTFQLRTYTSFSRFESDLLRGAPDFVFLNPYEMVLAKKAQGYIPLVRDKGPLVGILVARKDSGLHSARDVNRKDIAFPSPNAFAAALYIRALLAEREHIKFTPRYVKTHSNVYRTVLLGKVVAGGGVNKTFQLEPQELRDQLIVIYETPGIAPHPIAAHPRVPEKERKMVVSAILAMGRVDADRPMLQAIQVPGPRETDYEKDYRPLEKLGLERYVVEGTK